MRDERKLGCILLPSLLVAGFFLATVAFAAPQSAASDAFSTRVQRLGGQLICSCGCMQGALVCNHVGCPTVTQMRQEIATRAASNDSDDLVLQSFVQEYGSQVIAVPPARGFDLIAWIAPWVAAAAGLALLLWLVAHWSHRPALAASAASPQQLSGIRDQVAAEVAAELAAAPPPGATRHKG